MKKRKILMRLLLSFLAVFLIGFGLLQFPEVFFEKKLDYKAFRIYANDAINQTEDVNIVLDAVLENLQQSDFYLEGQTFKLFFIRGSFYERLIRLIGKKNMAFAFWDNQIYSAFPDFEKQLLHRNDNEFEILNLVQIISHESVHNQIYKKHSRWGKPAIPGWINEGYCEYISYLPIRKKVDYQLSNLISKLEKGKNEDWIKTEYGTWTPRYYIHDRALIEFLIDEKGFEITSIIIDKDLDPQKVYKEMKEKFGF
jgi:hypothetical protein